MRLFTQIILMLVFGYSSLFVYQYKGSGSNTASMQRVFDQKGTETPLIRLRVPSDSPVLKSTCFEIVSDNQVRIQNHLFNLVSLKIFSGFVELSVLLNDPSDVAKMKSLALNNNSRTGVLEVKQIDNFVLSLPPVPFQMSSQAVIAEMSLVFPDLTSAILAGFPRHFAGPPKATV